jgi:hypothetical protein
MRREFNLHALIRAWEINPAQGTKTTEREIENEKTSLYRIGGNWLRFRSGPAV